MVVVALGSNLEPRESHLFYALQRLKAVLGDLRTSSFHDTAPVDVRPQPRFLNAVAVGRLPAAVTPADLLETLLAIEQARGRTRPFAGAPRTLDLDLILIDDLVLDTPSLCLPHPHFRARRFVLAPLVEVAPEIVDPVSGLTARQLLDALSPEGPPQLGP